MPVPQWMQEIADKHNKLFTDHKVTDVYSNDMTSGYEFDGVNDGAHKVEQMTLQEYFDEGSESWEDDYNQQDLTSKAYALNELICANLEEL